MPRRPAKPKVTAKSSRAAHGPASAHNSARAVMLIDSRPIRERVRKQYEKVRRDLDQARQELDRFHKHDLPTFVRWLHQHFGSLLIEIRELRNRMIEQEDLIDEIETEVLFTGESYARAYQNIMADRKAAESAQANPEPEPDKEQRRGAHTQEDFFGDHDGEPHRRNPKRQPPAPAKPTLGSRIKELYRSIVRRLHPDTQKEVTAQKLEWWHQTQVAYQAGDEGQLEVILTLCELEEGADSGHSSLSILQRIIDQLKRSLCEIKCQLTSCRDDNAWNFAARTDLPLVQRRMASELMRELAMLRYQSEAMEKVLNKWKRGTARRRRRADAEDFSVDYF